MSAGQEVVSTTARAWAPAMDSAEYGALLNRLLEAERAGAKLLAAYCDELPLDSPAWYGLRAVQLDEARNCAVLLNRGQAWVAKRIAAALPRVPQSAQAALQAMLDSHLSNIDACEALRWGTHARIASSNRP